MTTGHVESESSGSCHTIDSAESTESTESTQPVECTESGPEAVMRIVAGLIRLRADTDTSIGTPTRVVETEGSLAFKFGNAGIAAASAFKIEFRCDVFSSSRRAGACCARRSSRSLLSCSLFARSSAAPAWRLAFTAAFVAFNISRKGFSPHTCRFRRIRTSGVWRRRKLRLGRS
jgi:hypothetical protein